MFEVQNLLLTFVGMKRIFHIISHFDLGGAERVALNISKSKTDDFEYHIVEVIRGRSSYTRQFIGEMQQANIHYHRSPIAIVSFHYLFEKIAAILFPFWFILIFLKYRPNIIHCHSEIPEWATYRLFHLFPNFTQKCQVIRTIHNTFLWNGLKTKGEKIETWLQDQQANIAISPSVLENYKQEYLGDNKQNQYNIPPIIYNGVAPSPIKRTYTRLRKNHINILFAGRMEEQKGIRNLVNIIKHLKDNSQYHFHIFGKGRLYSWLVKQIGQQENASINPPLFGLQQYLGSFDYLLMPSEHEGLALLSIEASMEGIPTIINATKGLEETLPVNWELKVNNNRIEEYLHLLETIIPNGNRNQWGQKAKVYAQANFSIEKMQKEYERIYRIHLLNQGSMNYQEIN